MSQHDTQYVWQWPIKYKQLYQFYFLCYIVPIFFTLTAISWLEKGKNDKQHWIVESRKSLSVAYQLAHPVQIECALNNNFLNIEFSLPGHCLSLPLKFIILMVLVFDYASAGAICRYYNTLLSEIWSPLTGLLYIWYFLQKKK